MIDPLPRRVSGSGRLRGWVLQGGVFEFWTTRKVRRILPFQLMVSVHGGLVHRIERFETPLLCCDLTFWSRSQAYNKRTRRKSSVTFESRSIQQVLDCVPRIPGKRDAQRFRLTLIASCTMPVGASHQQSREKSLAEA